MFDSGCSVVDFVRLFAESRVRLFDLSATTSLYLYHVFSCCSTEAIVSHADAAAVAQEEVEEGGRGVGSQVNDNEQLHVNKKGSAGDNAADAAAVDDLAFSAGAAKALARAALRSFTSSMPSGTVWAVCAVVGAAIAVAIAIVGAAYADSFERVTAADLVVLEYRYAVNGSGGGDSLPAPLFSACPPITSLYTNPSDPFLAPLHNSSTTARPFRMLRVGADGVLRRAEVIEGIIGSDSDADGDAPSSSSLSAVSVAVAPLSASSQLFASGLCGAAPERRRRVPLAFFSTTAGPDDLLLRVSHSPSSSSSPTPLRLVEAAVEGECYAASDAIFGDAAAAEVNASAVDVYYQFFCLERDVSDALFAPAATKSGEDFGEASNSDEDVQGRRTFIRLQNTSATFPLPDAMVEGFVVVPPHTTLAFARAAAFGGPMPNASSHDNSSSDANATNAPNASFVAARALPADDACFGDPSRDVYFRGAGDGSGYPAAWDDAPLAAAGGGGTLPLGTRGRFSMPRALPGGLGRSYAAIPKAGLTAPFADADQPWNQFADAAADPLSGAAVPIFYEPHPEAAGASNDSLSSGLSFAGPSPAAELPASASQPGSNTAPFAFRFSGGGGDALRYYGLNGSTLDLGGTEVSATLVLLLVSVKKKKVSEVKYEYVKGGSKVCEKRGRVFVLFVETSLTFYFC